VSAKATFTDREAAAVLFILDTVLVDEEPSEIRAALLRAAAKLSRQLAASYTERQEP
jgi:hypothetical protein